MNSDDYTVNEGKMKKCRENVDFFSRRKKIPRQRAEKEKKEWKRC